MEWTVVTVIVVLVGLFFTVGKPIMEYAKEMHNLRFETDRQEKEIDRNIETIKDLVKIAQAHENRLANQESETDKLAASITELVKLNQDHERRIHHLEVDSKSKDKGE